MTGWGMSRAVETGGEADTKYRGTEVEGAQATPHLPWLPLQRIPGSSEAGVPQAASVKRTLIPLPPAAWRRLPPHGKHLHPRSSCCCCCLHFQAPGGRRGANNRHGQRLCGCVSSRVTGCGGRAGSGDGGTTSSLCRNHAPVLLVCGAIACTLAPEPGSCRTMAMALRPAP